MYVSSTAKFSLRSQAKHVGDQVASRVSGFLAAVQVIDWEVPAEEILLFEDTLGIDAGEAVMFAATARRGDFILATGDKVCLRALAGCPECKSIAERMAGRVICLEQVVQRCIGTRGFAAVSGKIIPALDCDQALNAIFGTGLTASAAGVEDGLNSYIRELRGATGNLLVA